MNYNQFFKSLNDGKLQSVYLFHGEEEYIKESAFSALKSKLSLPFEELNMSIFDSGTADDIIAACDVAPFMADKRLTVCRFLPKDKDAKKIVEYIEHISPYCMIVFMLHGKADGKTLLAKKIKSLGGEVIFDYLTEDDAARWLVQHVKEEGCIISTEDARFTVQLVGRDVLSIKNEMSKLCDYVGHDGTITKEIISKVVIKNLEYQLYNTYAFFSNGKMQDGFRSLDNIMNGKDRESESMGVAGYFLSCLKAALTAHDLLERKASQTEMESVTGKRGYALKELCNTARKFTRNQLLNGIIAFSNVSAQKITQGKSSYNALQDAITVTFAFLNK